MVPPLLYPSTTVTIWNRESRTLKMVAFGQSVSMDIPNQSGTGIALFVVGALLFVPGLTLGDELLSYGTLVVAAMLLTVGTYLFGTSGSDRPV